SSLDFKAHVSTTDTSLMVKVRASRSFSNSPTGYKEFEAWVLKNHKDNDVPLHFLMEATGIYHEQAA
ncbi:MAG TPA: hypothetical protein VL947_01280, partial [Cytophagales bacterium]|nr:hypothetical protein [Cytophagales bacterium]